MAHAKECGEISLPKLIELVGNSRTILLTTHKQPDGDGLGAELALHLALESIRKNPLILNIDPAPKKYHFLNHNHLLRVYQNPTDIPPDCDLVLIFDTNDDRLIEPMFSEFKKRSIRTVFVDHHPLLKDYSPPYGNFWIDLDAPCTGELVLKLIKELKITIQGKIAFYLYLSLVFDTQLFRYSRYSTRAHKMAIELIESGITDIEKVHRGVISHQTKDKISFLSQALSKLEYFENHLIVVLTIDRTDLEQFSLESDEIRDITDQLLTIDSIEIALLVRELDKNKYRFSIRSKGRYTLLKVAEKFGGGGHWYAAGGEIHGNLKSVKHSLLSELSRLLRDQSKSAS